MTLDLDMLWKIAGYGILGLFAVFSTPAQALLKKLKGAVTPKAVAVEDVVEDDSSMYESTLAAYDHIIEQAIAENMAAETITALQDMRGDYQLAALKRETNETV